AEVVDRYTVKINLGGAWAASLAALSDATRTTAIASRTAHDKLGDDGLSKQAVGSGPFIFESWQPGQQLTLRRNDGYWDAGADGKALPYLDRVVYRFVP